MSDSQQNELLREMRAFRKDFQDDREETREFRRQQTDTVSALQALQSGVESMDDTMQAKLAVVTTSIKTGQYESTAEVEGGIEKIYQCNSNGLKKLIETAESSLTNKVDMAQIINAIKAAISEEFSEHKDNFTSVDKDNANSAESSADCAEQKKEIEVLKVYYAEQEKKFKAQIDGNSANYKFLQQANRNLHEELALSVNEIAQLREELASKDDNAQAEPGELLKMELDMKEMDDRYKEQMRAVNARYSLLFNQLVDLKGNIRVMVRIRPGEADQEVIDLTNPDEGSFLPWQRLKITTRDEQISHHGIRVEAKTYDGFQRVFGPNDTNQDVFDEIADIAQSAIYGKPCTVLGYGQTGCGKTHTFLAEDGIVPRYFELIFSLSQDDPDYKFEFELSAAEIYLGKIKDLLHDHSLGVIKPLKGVDKVVISDWARRSERLVWSLEVARKYLTKILNQRQTAATKGNATSSRSHLVISLKIRKVSKKETFKKTDSVINFVDLAGSEAPGKNGAQDIEFKEGSDVNMSLTELGTAIRTLREGNQIIGSHPLIKVLRNTLTSGSRLLLMYMISPLMVNLESTKNTLTKASEATGISASKAVSNSSTPSTSAKSQTSTPAKSQTPRKPTPSTSAKPQTPGRPAPSTSAKPQTPGRPKASTPAATTAGKGKTASTRSPPSNPRGEKKP
ncbi:P-loop containing nucleoside triphosphate hydrolase protein [Xylariaceae sp. FL1019]|nr:P-loop containing nucleoside triphosphate hydrolase protein [Xylariaceae sp. FL1019]